MTYFYLNPNHTFQECTLREWCEQVEEMSQNHSKHVADEVINGKRISTVWLGLNHQYKDGKPPLLFETMVFDNGCDKYMERYSSWGDAVEGHKRAIEWVLNGCIDND